MSKSFALITTSLPRPVNVSTIVANARTAQIPLGAMVAETTVEVSASASTTSTYWVARLPSNARSHGLSQIATDDMADTGSPTLDVGTFGFDGNVTTDDDDSINVRCFDQKRRFGIDFLWPLERYVTEPVTKGAITVAVTATGTVQPTNEVEISSELSGIVRNVLVDFNSAVTTGQTLAELDTDKLSSTVDSSRAKLQAAKAKVSEAEATVLETRLERERQQQLVTRRVGAAQQLETAEAAHQRALAALKSAKADVAAATADLALNETNLEKAVIRSPITGGDGNVEFLVDLRRADADGPPRSGRCSAGLEDLRHRRRAEAGSHLLDGKRNLRAVNEVARARRGRR